MATNKEDRAAQDPAAYFANYQEYNKTLRTWFVTFGLGVPALFLVNDKLWPIFYAYGQHAQLILSYLLGCAVQVGIAIINKFIAWHNYDDHQGPTQRRTLRHALCRRLENAFWVDMIADFATVVFFAYSTIEVFRIFAR